MTVFSSLSDKWLFGRVSPVIRLARRKALGTEDMPSLPPKFDPATATHLFHDLPLHGSGWRFMSGIVKAMRPTILRMVGLAGLVTLMNLCSPLLVYALVSFVAQTAIGKAPLWQGLAVATALCATSALFAMLLQHYFYMMLGNTQTIVNGLNNRLYQHALQLTRQGRFRRPTGDVVNLMGTDTDAVADIIFAGTDLFYACVTVLAVSAMLFHFLGVAAWAGLAMLLLIIPLTRILVRRFTRLDSEILTYRDQRVSLVSQILSGIRIVKFFAWEPQIRAEVDGWRQREIQARRRLAKSGALSLLVYFSGSTLVGAAAFGLHLALGRELDAPTVFACITLFGMLDGPFGNLTEYIANIAAAKVSAERIAGFLQEERHDDTHHARLSPPHQALGLVWENVAARYADGERNAIAGLNLSLAPGEAVAIVGPVGSGKTSLLYTLLDEIPLRTGRLSLTGVGVDEKPRMAFVPQESFVLNSSLAGNIRLGDRAQDHDEERLHQAITAAELWQDIKEFPAGIATEIGEHGVNLSGGQKQRVSLARADYAEAGLILLDDPLSALDFAVEDTLINNLIFGRWQGITRLMVTHRLRHLARFDRILFVKDGLLVAHGNFAELMASSPDFVRFVAETTMEQQSSSTAAPESNPKTIIKSDETQAAARITDDEDREKGAVDASLYRDYLRLLGGDNTRQRRYVLPSLVIVTLLTTILPILQNTWLSVWANHMHGDQGHGSEGTLTAWLATYLGHPTQNLLIYVALGLAVLAAVLVRYLLWMLRAIAAGKHLHDAAFNATLAAPPRFFDATPVGRILNRFSRDVDAVERELAWSFEQTIRSSVHTLGSLLVLVSLFPPLTFIVLPLAWAFRGVQAAYRSASREAQRLTSIARSPRFAHFKETLQGLTSIRAYGKGQVFHGQNLQLLANYQRMFHALVIFNRWFSIRIPLLSAGLSIAVMASLLWASQHGVLLAGTAGLAIIYALRFWESLNWSIRSFSQVEAKMTAVERLQAFASLTPEPQVLDGFTPLTTSSPWPTQGAIVFEKLSARYAPHLPLILKDVSFHVPSGTRLGVIGRTGSGKSTLFQVLYRFINPSQGRVLIDSVDTRSIPLSRLRSALAIIPQDPTLFKGDLRANLDRFQQHSDEALWHALARAHMDTFVRQLPGGLAAEVKENGHNFSQGQRQLFCLARALLQNARIIVMDEATASVDVGTDALIQATIRQECADRTVLIIAHRLATVADCDAVLELKNGRVIYHGDPKVSRLRQLETAIALGGEAEILG